VSQPPLHIRFGRFELDEDRHALLENGVAVSIGPKPLALLFHLARHRDRVVRKDELLRAVWPGVVVTDDAIAQVVLKAREALGEVGGRARIVATVRGVGFRFGVDAEPVGATVAPVLAHAASSLVGRARELGVLRSALARAISGSGGLALVMGEAGIGKTRLVEELAAVAEQAGVEVHRARGQDAAGTPAFWLWAQILRGCAEHWDVERLRDTLMSGATELARVAPLLREKLALAPPMLADTEESRFRLYEALTRFVERAARVCPQVLVVDDLQWLDPDSLHALSHLAGELRGERVFVVATVRDDDLARRETLQDLVIEYEKLEALVRIPLRGLAPDDVGRLVEEQTGLRATAGVLAALQRRTGGNPFFVRQLIGLATASGADPDWSTEVASLERVAMPLGMRRLASRRLENLSPACRSLLELAAAISREFSLALVTRAHGGDRAEVLRTLDEGVAARIVAAEPKSPQSYVFTHDVVREVLLAELPTPRRGELHLQVAQALEAMHAGHLAPIVPALAYHYAEAAPLLEGSQAVDYAKWAGDLARGVAAYADAADHYERALRALELLPRADARRRAELLVCAGWAHQSAGRTTHARRVLEDAAAVARSAGDPELFAMAALGFAEFFVSPGSTAAVSLLREALAMWAGRQGGLRIWIESALAIQLVGDNFNLRDEAERLTASAEKSARSLGTRRSLAAALLARAFVARTASVETARQRIELADEATEVVRDRGEVTLEVMASVAREVAWMDLGERDAADRELLRLEHLLGRLHSSYWRAVVPAMRSARALLDARFDEAEALARSAFAASDLPSFPYELSLAGVLGAIRFEQGRGAEIVGMVEPLLRTYAPYAVLRAAHVFALAEAGRLEDARRGLDALAEEGFEKLGITDNWTFTVGLLARACFAVGDAGAARALASLLAPRASECVDLSNGHLCTGPIAFYLALLALTCGDLDEADRHLSMSLARAESLRSPLYQAWTLAIRSHAQSRRGNAAARRSALRLADEARALATGHGMARLLRELDARRT
jgi:DNA-binding winged helix-turn-helix (wHTH) protein/tetratricopeptide (TPR) repeat protein